MTMTRTCSASAGTVTLKEPPPPEVLKEVAWSQTLLTVIASVQSSPCAHPPLGIHSSGLSASSEITVVYLREISGTLCGKGRFV